MGVSTQRRVRRVLLAVAAAACIGACGTNNEPQSSVDAFVRQFCGVYYGPCCASGQKTVDQEACVEGYRDGHWGAAVDQAKADACLARTRAAHDTEDLCTNGPDVTLSQLCEQARLGAPGGATAAGDECSSTSDCARVDGAHVRCIKAAVGSNSTYRCQVLALRREGETCEGSLRDGLLYTGATPPVSYFRASACDSGQGLLCDRETSKCRAIQSAGGPCSDVQGCVEGTRCNFTTGTCVALLPAGAPCPTDGSGNEDCAKGTMCGPDLVDPKCTPLPDLGAPCLNRCRRGSCDNGVCARKSIESFGLVCR